MERSSGPMHEVIRRVYEDVHIHFNYQNSIKTVTLLLQYAKNSEHSGLVPNDSLRSASLDRAGSASEISSHGTVRNSQSTSSIVGSISSNQTKSSLSDRTVVQGVVVQGDLDRASGTNDFQPRLVLNHTQKLRLLLLRADAYSATKQHEKAIEDARTAFLCSFGRSPEAQFIMGREYYRLFRLPEAVAAFDKAESLLLTSVSDGNFFADEITDEDFWAQRGFQMGDVERLKLNRSEVELQERNKMMKLTAEQNNGEVTVGGSFSSPMGSFEVLGSDNPDIMQWRSLAKEARALLTMRTSHLLPINVLQATLLTIDQRMNLARSGVVVCVENTTSQPFRFVGCSSLDTAFQSGMHFPRTIPPGHCGVALLQPRTWGGFTGAVCYEVGEGGVCAFFCFENSLMGNVRCGVRFASERRSLELCRALQGYNDSVAGSSASGGVSLKEFMSFKIPNPNEWSTGDTAALPSGRRLKVSGAVRGGNRAIIFSAAEMLDVRLRSVELLTALEFAGPLVLKKLSLVSKRYRELVNNLPPPMFFGGGRRSFPDYALRSDRMISPWIVHDKEPVNWYCIFDSRTFNRENFVITDSTDPQNIILWFSVESGGSLEAIVYYGDKRSPIAQIKSSWKLFSSTLYFSTPSGRTFASCYVNQSSNLTLAWGDAGSKSKSGDVEYVMCANEMPQRRDTRGRGDSFSNISKYGNINSNSVHQNASMSLSSGTRGFVPNNVVSSQKANGAFAGETYAVLRPRRISGGTAASNIPNPTSGEMEVAGEVTVITPVMQTLMKNTTVAEMKIFPGADALLFTLMAFCRSQWEN